MQLLVLKSYPRYIVLACQISLVSENYMSNIPNIIIGKLKQKSTVGLNRVYKISSKKVR